MKNIATEKMKVILNLFQDLSTIYDTFLNEFGMTRNDPAISAFKKIELRRAGLFAFGGKK